MSARQSYDFHDKCRMLRCMKWKLLQCHNYMYSATSLVDMVWLQRISNTTAQNLYMYKVCTVTLHSNMQTVCHCGTEASCGSVLRTPQSTVQQEFCWLTEGNATWCDRAFTWCMMPYLGTPSNSSTVMYTRVGMYTFFPGFLPPERPRVFFVLSLSSEDEDLFADGPLLSSSTSLFEIKENNWSKIRSSEQSKGINQNDCNLTIYYSVNHFIIYYTIRSLKELWKSCPTSTNKLERSILSILNSFMFIHS